jgi:transposase
LEVKYERCCGLDVHKQRLVACCILSEAKGVRKEFRSFGTLTDEILALSDWLLSLGVTQVGMESTGSYWKPVWNLLETSFQLMLVNPQHVKAYNRDKTDMKDSEWLADLLRHGLLKASFVPQRGQRELRELIRYRTSLVEERAAEVNRLQKVLEGANVKLASVASDIMGKSGREMLAALLAAEQEPAAIAQLAKGKLREKIPQLERALVGNFGRHQRFLVAQQLGHIDFLEEILGQVNQEVANRLDPLEAEAAQRLDAIPGIAQSVAEVVIAEVGTDMGRFPSANHLTSWAGLCPGNRKSAGKSKGGKTRKGNQALRRALVQAAHAAALKPGCYLQAQFQRLVPRLGRKKAYIAVARQMLVIIYHMLKNSESIFREKGAHHVHEEQAERSKRHFLRRLEALGYQVTLQPQPS